MTTALLTSLTNSSFGPDHAQWHEIFGDKPALATALTSPVHGMSQYFCRYRSFAPHAKLAGVTIKTYGADFSKMQQSGKYDEVWKYLADHDIPVAVVERNPLDVIISVAEHSAQAYYQSNESKPFTMRIDTSDPPEFPGAQTLETRLHNLLDA